MNHSKYCLSLATTFAHLSGGAQIRVWQREDERYHAVESPFRDSPCIVDVFRAVLGSNASIAFDTVPH